MRWPTKQTAFLATSTIFAVLFLVWSNSDFNTGNSTQSETIHIVAAISTYRVTYSFYQLVKSILVSKKTTNPVHFHIIADDQGALVAETIFNTWKIPRVNFTIYKLNGTHQQKIDLLKIKNNHYSPVLYNLGRLLIPEVVTDAEKIISMDLDIIVLEDIEMLWRNFETMKQNHAYLAFTQGLDAGDNHPKLPKVFERNINSGVFLFDMGAIRHDGINWFGTILKVFEFKPLEAGAPLQSVLKALIVAQPGWFLPLPCFINRQNNNQEVAERHCPWTEFWAARGTTFRAIHLNIGGHKRIVFLHKIGNETSFKPIAKIQLQIWTASHFQFAFTKENFGNVLIIPHFMSSRWSPAEIAGTPLGKSLLAILAFSQLPQLETLCKRKRYNAISVVVLVADGTAEIAEVARTLKDPKNRCLAYYGIQRIYYHVAISRSQLVDRELLLATAKRFAPESDVYKTWLLIDGMEYP